MKYLATTLTLVVLIAFTANTQNSAVWEPVDNCFEAMHEYDANSFADNFTSDATLIAPFGKMMRGKSEIRESHKKIFKKWGPGPKEVTEVQTNKKVEYLTNDIALLTFINSTKGDKAREGEVSYSILLKKVNGDWLVHMVQMTPIVPMPKQ